MVFLAYQYNYAKLKNKYTFCKLKILSLVNKNPHLYRKVHKRIIKMVNHSLFLFLNPLPFYFLIFYNLYVLP